jgi:hypothetical protein
MKKYKDNILLFLFERGLAFDKQQSRKRFAHEQDPAKGL